MPLGTVSGSECPSGRFGFGVTVQGLRCSILYGVGFRAMHVIICIYICRERESQTERERGREREREREQDVTVFGLDFCCVSEGFGWYGACAYGESTVVLAHLGPKAYDGKAEAVD